MDRRKLDLQPINIYELVTFYPMFHRSGGQYHFEVCRTLSCALGVLQLHEHFCKQLGLDPRRTDRRQPDGKFTSSLWSAWQVAAPRRS
jgi:NADH-quinone oxidoreductase subunit E